MNGKKYGSDLLLEQLFEYFAADWGWMLDDAPGDSKIEKLLFRALAVRSDCCACNFQLLLAQDSAFEVRIMNGEIETDPSPAVMIVRPQAEIEQRRVDFFIHVFHHIDRLWKPLIVECDGHDYHERTKYQAARDRSKDRSATLAGYDFFRFTGSEIWRDPWGCAKQISDWAEAKVS